MTKFIIFLISFSCMISSFGQSSEDQILEKYRDYKYNHPTEHAFISTDRNVYFNGGVIDISTLIFDQYHALTQLSKVTYIDMIHENGLFFERFVLRSDSGVANMRYTIPVDIPTGNYQLVAYTQFMRNFDLNSFVSRKTVYIQNTLESYGDVVKNVFPSNLDRKTKINEEPYLNSRPILKIEETESDIYIEIENKEYRGKHFLVAEGLGGIQFISKIVLKNAFSNIRISKSNLKGTFHKFVLLDESSKLVSLVGYCNLDVATDSNQKNKLILKKRIDKKDFGGYSSKLFKKLYKLFYNIPEQVSIESYSVEILASNTFLQEISDYYFLRWKVILEEQFSENNYEFLPEENIVFEGKIETPNLLDGNLNIAFHFFRQEYDLFNPIDTSGYFSFELILPSNKDHVSVDVIDDDLSLVEDFTLLLKGRDKMEYISPYSFYDKALAETKLDSLSEFHYMLSTFYEVEEEGKFFWSNLLFDKTYKTKDYYSLETFEDFIREAVGEVIVTREDGEKVIKTYSAYTGTYEDPQLLIVNDKVLNSSTELFNLPLNEIVSISVATKDETLKEIGTGFIQGVIAIYTTNAEIEQNLGSDKNGFIDIYSYYKKDVQNPVAAKFKNSSLFIMNKDTSDFEDNIVLPVIKEVLDTKGRYYIIAHD